MLLLLVEVPRLDEDDDDVDVGFSASLTGFTVGVLSVLSSALLLLLLFDVVLFRVGFDLLLLVVFWVVSDAGC